jgi:hypothetical protein
VSESVEAAPPAAPRNRSIETRRAARRLKHEREKLIVESLNRGISIPEIAASCGVTEKHMRACVRETLARRVPAPPAEFLAIQVSRLNEALLVAYSAMSGANLKAVDRVVKIVRELDRYHGFVVAERRLPDASRLAGPEQSAPSLEAARAGGRQMAPQALEKMESEPEDEMALEAVDPEDWAAELSAVLTSRLAAARPQDPLAFDAPQNARRKTAPQPLQNMESAPDNDVAREAAAAAARLRAELASRLAALQDRLASGSPPTGIREMAPQTLEKMESGPENGMDGDASDSRDAGTKLDAELASALGRSPRSRLSRR